MHLKIKPIKYELYISVGCAGKYKSLDEFDRWEMDTITHPRFGRYWWFWKPNLCNNGGRFNKRENVDINFHFLCLWLSFTFYPDYVDKYY